MVEELLDDVIDRRLRSYQFLQSRNENHIIQSCQMAMAMTQVGDS